MEELPETLNDAIIVTRYLGIRHLWIDALCIIQDDPVDWSQEAGKMGEIYMNASCTIAAHSASHADDGFLAKSLALVTPVRLGSEQPWVSLPGHHRSDIDKSHLSSRGWVFQERLLSQRTITLRLADCIGKRKLELQQMTAQPLPKLMCDLQVTSPPGRPDVSQLLTGIQH